jgi:osmotically-inducible protein OsmY
MKRSLYMLVCGLAILMATSCQAAAVGAGAAGVGSAVAISNDPRTSGTVIDDQTLRRKVSSYLNDKYPNNNIEVTAYQQSILLTGQVMDITTKIAAARDANDYPGVNKVYNYLTVGEIQSIAQDNKDAWITTKAKTTLIATKGIQANNVKVVTTNSVIYVFGVVTPRQAKVIKNKLRSINGVRKVVTFFNKI